MRSPCCIIMAFFSKEIWSFRGFWRVHTYCIKSFEVEFTYSQQQIALLACSSSTNFDLGNIIDVIFYYFYYFLFYLTLSNAWIVIYVECYRYICYYYYISQIYLLLRLFIVVFINLNCWWFFKNMIGYFIYNTCNKTIFLNFLFS